MPPRLRRGARGRVRRTRARFRLHAVSAAGGRRAHSVAATGRTRSSGTPSTRAASSSSAGISLALSPWALAGTAALAVALGTQGARRGALPRGDLPGVRRLLRRRSASASSPSSTDRPRGRLRGVVGAWPEPVERVSSFLRESGVDARIHEFPDGTPTAQDAATAAGCELDQIVKSLVLVCDERPVRRLRSGRPPVRPAEGRSRPRCGVCSSGEGARGGGSHRLRAGRRRALSTPEDRRQRSWSVRCTGTRSCGRAPDRRGTCWRSARASSGD